MDQIKDSSKMLNVAKIGGTMLSAFGENNAGKGSERLAKYQAKQLEQNAKQSVAEGTVAAQDEQRKSALIASRAIAVAAASGAGALDPTVVKILQGISAEGTLASATQMYNANEQARGQLDQAKGARYSGKQAAKAGRTKMLNTLLTGASSIATTWGGADEGEPSYKALKSYEPVDNWMDH